MRKIILPIIFCMSSAQAEDVYNFYFQKPPAAPSVKPVENPVTTTAAVPVIPSEPEKISHWKLAVGWGENDDPLGHLQGNLFMVGYNFNKYFGLTATALFKSSLSEAPYAYDGLPNHNKYDFGVTLKPFALNSFGYDLFEVELLAGITNTHVLEGGYVTTDGDGMPPAIAQENTTYMGIGLNLNLTKSLGISFFSKKSSKAVVKSVDWDKHFEYSGVTLAWRI
jgi:hypothetical protein